MPGLLSASLRNMTSSASNSPAVGGTDHSEEDLSDRAPHMGGGVG